MSLIFGTGIFIFVMMMKSSLTLIQLLFVELKLDFPIATQRPFEKIHLRGNGVRPLATIRLMVKCGNLPLLMLTLFEKRC